jgi:nitroreductase
MAFSDLVKVRRSVRKYRPESVSREDILKILDCANWAPSASNRQPWEFIVVNGDWIKRLSESYRDIVEEFTRNVEIKDIGNVASNKDFIRFASAYGGAPVVVVVLVKKHSDPREAIADIQSASAAMENLVLAAAESGLGTCWMTGPLRDENSLRSILSVPDDKDIVAVSPLGYPDEIPKPVPRKDPELKQKITWLE